jgi:acetyl-CoA carboxylase biotin carboxylase subunit
MFRRVLIPNRGEIAVRIIRACRDLGIETVLAASSVDADASMAAHLADEVIRIGGPRPSESYLNLPAILTTAKAAKVDSLHPGYGFLSEDASLAEGCREIGISFIGPQPEVIDMVGNKATSREIAEATGVPVSPGRLLPAVSSRTLARELDRDFGYPLLIKAVHGGGGRGLRLVNAAEFLVEQAASAAMEAAGAFGNADLYVERWVPRARHVEVQIMGLGVEEILVLGDRDCSVQRRHQKLIEEAPAPTLSDDLRRQLHESARKIGEYLRYENAGTVEFVVDEGTGEFFFLEVNARLQVEHPITEAVTGIDIVRAQFEVASGAPVSPLLRDEPTAQGTAIECRINAECPARNFQPSPGSLESWRPPTSSCIRVDSHGYGGYVVPPYYDSLLAKVVAFGSSRIEAIKHMVAALQSFEIAGVETTIEWAAQMVASPEFASSQIHTRWVDEQALTHA